MAGDMDHVAAAIADPRLRERFLAALAGGHPLSDEELFGILSDLADPRWRQRGLDLACPDPERNAKLLELLAVDEVDTDVPRGKRSTVDRPGAEAPAGESALAKPERIGKYRVVRYLGGGGFGDVWLGWDDSLDRAVAIKMPRAGKLAGEAAAVSFLAEANKAAALEHPNIVPVWDVGQAEDGRPFIVSRFVDGPTLRQRLCLGTVAADEAVRIVATVARALHHAHTTGAGLVHRDVKPANILLDESSATPFLADFGLAIPQTRSLAETDVAGTPAYTSPEQTAGEKVDARSDVFSLGAVLYELLTNARPFSGASKHEILAAVARASPVPPRDRSPGIAAELERICLRALARGKRDRYQAMGAFADDLEAWVGEHSRPVADEADVPVVPRGLRSFDGDDAHFFLQLLPGPRGRDGLPESVRFWKTRLDETDPEKTFAIGLLYGPSGCGKSSLVKAGTVPRLGAGVPPSSSRPPQTTPSPGSSRASAGWFRGSRPRRASWRRWPTSARLSRARSSSFSTSSNSGSRPIPIRREASWRGRCGSATASSSRR
jgi:serine/threonine protein kinase